LSSDSAGNFNAEVEKKEWSGKEGRGCRKRKGKQSGCKAGKAAEGGDISPAINSEDKNRPLLLKTREGKGR